VRPSPTASIAVQDALRAAFPGFERLEVSRPWPPALWRCSGGIRNFPTGFYTYQLSEGHTHDSCGWSLCSEFGIARGHPAGRAGSQPTSRTTRHPGRFAAGSFASVPNRGGHALGPLVRFLNPNEVMVADLAEDGLTKLTLGRLARPGKMARRVHSRSGVGDGPARGAGLRIVLIVEGKTEKACSPAEGVSEPGYWRQQMPRICNRRAGRIPNGREAEAVVTWSPR
jgi:hypothetical protein